MKFTNKTIKAAWKIRKESALKWNCGVMEISWKECLKMVKEKTMQEILVDAGGNLWEKGNTKRVYFNDTSLNSHFGIDLDWLKGIKKDKKTSYYCVRSNSFYSKNGVKIRNAMRVKYEDMRVNKI